MSETTYDSIEFAERELKKRLNEYGFAHSVGVATTASLMATLYGVNPLDAYMAGLLHDWDRNETHENLIARARRFGIDVDDIIACSPRLVHAHTGAYGAREYFESCANPFELTDEVFHAIEHHTVGVPDMSELDMIVYVADMIEPSRSFPAVESLREMVGTIGLDQLFFQAYQQTMKHLVTYKKVIHPDTLGVWNSLVLKVEE